MEIDLHTRDYYFPSHFQSSFSDYHDHDDYKAWGLSSSLAFGSLSSGSSALSSPVESELGNSTETDQSDNDDSDDDHIAELTRLMAQSTLQEDDHNYSKHVHDIPSIDASSKQDKVWSLSGSPQSTLWSPLGLGHGHGSPNGSSSKEPSPPVTPVKVRCNDGPKYRQQTQKPNFNIGFGSINDYMIDNQIKAQEFYKLKVQEQVQKQEGCLYHNDWETSVKIRVHDHFDQNIYCTACGGSGNEGRASFQGLSTKTWPTPQQQAGSVMRAVFLTGPGSINGSSCGTGVFLPRGIANSSDQPRKKHGCSTVLIPARVVQALKLHFDKMGNQSVSSNYVGGLLDQQDALVGSKNVMYSLQNRQSKSTTMPPAMSQNDHQIIGLPQEWTY